VYVAASVEVDFEVRSRAAYLLVEGSGVLSGYSAAELLGASCAPDGAPAEVFVPAGRRALPGLTARRGRLCRDEIEPVDDIWTTTPLRPAYDLARRGSLIDAVVALDALGYACGVVPVDVVRFGYRHLGHRGSRRLPEAVGLANPLAESPMETRIRLAIVLTGLPAPVLRHPVGPYFLDMAYPQWRLGVEYDGREHLAPERARRDLVREGYLGRAGWEVVRFRWAEVCHRPDRVAERVRSKIAAAAT
jgi:very-short-patch-repair endonuclease